MKRNLFITVILALMLSCTKRVPQPAKSAGSELDTVYNDNQISKVIYKPGLGELMLRIQLHHSKLWFAGSSRNWKLAEYEIKELKGIFSTIKELQSDRIEIKDIPSINPAVDTLALSVKRRNLNGFKSGFQTLTNKCNSCHRANNSAFNVIKIPTAPPFSNQEYKALRSR